jgi:hypothetical protein
VRNAVDHRAAQTASQCGRALRLLSMSARRVRMGRYEECHQPQEQRAPQVAVEDGGKERVPLVTARLPTWVFWLKRKTKSNRHGRWNEI